MQIITLDGLDGANMSKDDTITHCAACGRPFGPKQSWTIAAWFKCGTPKLSDIVCLACRHKRMPDRCTTRKAAS